MLLYLNQFLKVELLTIFIFIYFKELCWLYLSLSQYVVRPIPCITLSSSSSRQCWTTLYSGTHTGTYVINVIRLSFSRSTQTAFFFFPTTPTIFPLQKVLLSHHSSITRNSSHYLLPTSHACRCLTIQSRSVTVLILRKGRLAETQPLFS